MSISDEPSRAQPSTYGQAPDGAPPPQRSRLNLSRLRRSCSECSGPSGSAHYSRRQMLGMTAGTAVGTSHLLKALEAPLHGQFALRSDSRRLAFTLDGKERWVIDTRRFAGSPRISVRRAEQLIRVELRDALYPGTSQPADLRCDLRLGITGWNMRLRLTLGGFDAELPLERWLAGREVARSRVQLRNESLPLGNTLALRLEGDARAEFTPSWELRLSGSQVATLDGLGGYAISDTATLSLLSPEAPSIMRSSVSRRTAVRLERGERAWEFDLGLRGGDGWMLRAENSAFDLVDLEMGVTRAGFPRRALLATSSLAADGARLHFEPAGQLFGPGGTAFRLPLLGARLAVAFDPGGDETVVLARYGDPVWLRTGSCAFQIGDAEEVEPFELHDGHLHCAPALLRVAAPMAGAIVEPAPLPAGQRLTFVSKRPLRRLNPSHARIHLDAAGSDILPRSVIPFAASVLRPDDLLYLRFTSENLNLETPSGKAPQIVVADAGRPAYLIVTFQPQNIVERAYYETDPNYPDPHDTGDPPDAPPVQNRMAGTSRLVFEVPGNSAPIPYTLASLLDWSQWSLNVVPVAVEPGTRPPRTVNGVYPAPQAPATNQTAIEAPWRLILSPPDQLSGPGRAAAHAAFPHAAGSDIVRGDRYFPAWAHATDPVSHLNAFTNTTSTELWHTRYAGQKAGGPIDETLGEAMLTLRAIWSPDYPTTVYRGNAPFRASLKGDWRHDIVDLTSNFTLIDDHTHGNYLAAPVAASQLMLSALGAWLKVHGAWDQPGISNVLDWRHIAAMGRDHYVRVVEAGYLFPFGHPAALVTVTERKFRLTDAGRIAYLFQHKFIVVRQSVKTYMPDDYAGWSGGYDGRNMPFKSVRITTLVTPNLEDPDAHSIKGTKPGTAFWPYVGPNAFSFHLVGTDVTGETADFTAPLIFVMRNIGKSATSMGLVRNDYSTGGLNTADLAGQKVAYFDPGQVHKDDPSEIPMDPHLATARMTFDAAIPTGFVVLQPNQPLFFPVMDVAEVTVPALKRIIGQDAPTAIRFNTGAYEPQGLDPKANRGQVFADLVHPLPMVFGVKSPSPEVPAAPALASPNMLITGLSAIAGPIGGDPNTFASGTVRWSDVFGDPKGLLGQDAPKLLGFVPLHRALGTSAAPKDAPKLTHTVPAGDFLGGAAFDDTLYTFTHDLIDVTDLPLLPKFLGYTDDPGHRGTVTMEIHNLQPAALSGSGGAATPASRLEIQTELTNFTVDAWGMIIAQFEKFAFSVDSDKKFEITGTKFKSIHFGGALQWIEIIATFFEKTFGGGGAAGAMVRTDGDPLFEVKPFIKPVLDLPPSLIAGVTISIPHIPAGVLNLGNLTLTSELIFTLWGRDPIHMRFELSSRERPFFLSVFLFGGGGSFAIELAPGNDTVEGTLEFGAVYEVNLLGLAHGMAAAMAGIYFHLSKEEVVLAGYFRMGGSLSVIKLITASVEFYLELRYLPGEGAVYGQATVTVEVSIPFFSVSVDLSCEQKFAGSSSKAAALALADRAGAAVAADSGPPSISTLISQADWTDYCHAFS